MSKAVTKGAHWLPRHAQYSLHGQRNGRVDVLPPGAKMPTFGELEQRYNRTKQEYQAAHAAYTEAKNALQSDTEYKRHMEFFHRNKDRQYIAMPSKFAKKLDELKALKDRLGALGSRLEDYRMAFFQVRDIRYERAWLTVARLMLPWEVVRQIDHAVNENLKKRCD